MKWDGEVPGVPEATIGTVVSLPAVLPGGVQVGPHSQARRGALLRVVPGVARYLVSRGTAIAVAAENDADPDDVMSFLLGGVRGALIHQRGELPLHAATVIPPGERRAVAICGASGMGKSTLAAELVLRGWSLLADDMTRITWTDSAPMAWPCSSGIKLTSDALVRLNLAAAQLTRVAPAVDKMLLGVSPQTGPVRLAWVISLNRDPAPSIRKIAGSTALTLLTQQTFRLHYVSALGIAAEHLRMIARVAATCRFAALSGYPGVATLADTLAATLRNG